VIKTNIDDIPVEARGYAMSGLLALLDDVAALAKIAAANVDDVAAQASKMGMKVAASVIDDTVKAGSKSLGVVIDDTAVTPKYIQNLPAARELPIVWKIAQGSLFNKLVILLPLALLLNIFAPWLLTPLLMLGGAYLCFEGAEKILHRFTSHEEHGPELQALSAAHLEKERVSGAIKTDFILSAEIMTIALAAIEADSLWVEGVVLALVAIGITALVYGCVALLVKADDAGLRMTQVGRLQVTRAFGRFIVKGMPSLMILISSIGTAAMLWVGGSIVIHGLEGLGWETIGHAIHDLSLAAADATGVAEDAIEWIVKATLDGLFGLALGLLLAPSVTYATAPFRARFERPRSPSQR
jgi:predicted DNA repair protein MutK